MNKNLLVVCHCYAGDRRQVLELLPAFEHHGAPIVIVSPADSQVHGVGPHICRCAGKRAYIGQDSWDRQHLQLKLLLEYPQEWFLLNDADSFVATPELPEYLFEDDNIVYSNEVEDFRKPGQSWQDMPPWPMDYHAGLPLIAMQPPYFLSRSALTKIVAHSAGLTACPITPFIDWWWIPACRSAGVNHRPFKTGASCETVTANGLAVMKQRVTEHGASFIHSVKSGRVMREIMRWRRESVSLA